MPTTPLKAGFPFKQKSILIHDSRVRAKDFCKKLIEIKVSSSRVVGIAGTTSDLPKHRIITRIFKRVPDKTTNRPICWFFAKCPLVQSGTLHNIGTTSNRWFWPASLYFKTTFGLSKGATSSRLQRGAALHIYSLRNGILFEGSVAKTHGTKRRKISGRVDELCYKGKISLESLSSL